MSTIIYIGAIFLGLLTSSIFEAIGVYTGDRAIEYYAEVHQSKWSSFIHTIGMPFTYYGLLLFVPPMFCMNTGDTIKLQAFFYFYFISYYLTLDVLIAIMVSICYLPSQVYAMRYYYMSTNRFHTMLYGFTIASMALLTQEILGHWCGGDDPSRLEGIPNAIWHAGYYSIWHLIHY